MTDCVKRGCRNIRLDRDHTTFVEKRICNDCGRCIAELRFATLSEWLAATAAKS